MNSNVLVASAAAMALASSVSASVLYDLQITAFYQFGTPSDFVMGPAANPDTSYARITNNGTSTFTGIFQLSGTDAGNNFYITTWNTVLAPGGGGSISLTDESSNRGGFNKDAPNPDFGMLVEIIGTVTNANGESERVDCSWYDRDIHSGVFKLNPFGELLDNYILQGGDPFGRDTGDDFEVNQAPGVVHCTNIPAPASAIGLTLGACVILRRRRTR